jgi:hypothetical protein
MTLREQIQDDVKKAMKEKRKDDLATLRFLSAGIKQKEVDERKELSDEEVIQLIQSQIKKREESVESFTKGNREDLAEKEKAGIELMRAYLPEQLSSDELEKIVEESIQEAGASGPKDMGKVMKVIMPKVQGRADGKAVNQVVRSKLQS